MWAFAIFPSACSKILPGNLFLGYRRRNRKGACCSIVGPRQEEGYETRKFHNSPRLFQKLQTRTSTTDA